MIPSAPPTLSFLALALFRQVGAESGTAASCSYAVRQNDGNARMILWILYYVILVLYCKE